MPYVLQRAAFELASYPFQMAKTAGHFGSHHPFVLTFDEMVSTLRTYSGGTRRHGSSSGYQQLH